MMTNINTKILFIIRIKIFLFFILIPLGSLGQEMRGAKVGESIYYQLNTKTPGVTDFIKYGNTATQLYTGTIDLQIPLISASQKNQSPINVSIAYNSSGFLPAKRSGLVGLNWFLNVGGAITREVRDTPDDNYGTPQDEFGTYGTPTDPYTLYGTNGFIVGTKKNTYPIDDVYSFKSSTGYIIPGTSSWSIGVLNNDDAYEPAPDIFSFNFNGISGKFFMGNDGQVKVVTNAPNYLKVDLTKFATQEFINTCYPKESEIKITDNLGNQYFFGGKLNNLEYTIFLGSQYSGKINGSPRPVITSWFLTKIIYADNNSEINFTYREDTLKGNYCIGASLAALEDNKSFLALNGYTNESRLSSFNQICCVGANEQLTGIRSSPSYELQKKAILEKIEGDDFIINFKYSDQDHMFNKNLLSIFEFKDIKLDNVNLTDKRNNIINNIDFIYQYLGGTNNRMFLSTVTELGKKPYTFEYDVTDDFPDPNTKGIDYWGFWNGLDGQNGQYGFIPNMTYNANGDFTYTTNVREPVFSKSKQGLLNKVTYPTGGNTKFEYQPHLYSKRLERTSSNNFNPALVTVSGTAGGARIWKITDFDGVNNSNIREFKYVKSYSPATPTNTLSSGILLQWPRYGTYWKIDNGKGIISEQARVSSSSFGKAITENTMITYGEVAEVTSTNGYTLRKFKDYESTPDISNNNTKDTGKYDPSFVTPARLYENFVGIFFDDRSIERGKLISKKIFDNSNNLLSEELFSYNEDVNRFNNYSVSIHGTGLLLQANKVYFYNDYLSQKVTKTYVNSSSLSTTENSTYNSLTNNLISKTFFNSTGEKLETKYFYSADSQMSAEPNINIFATKNIIGIPLKIQGFKGIEKISEQKTQYGYDSSTSSLLARKYIYANKGVNNVALADLKITFDKYDEKGNVLQYTPEGGIPVSIIWGYNKTQPIAKIENMLYSSIPATTITNLQTLSNADNDNCLSSDCGEQQLREALKIFRNSLSVTAFLTTYTYNPLIGITSITDAKGIAAYYEYDASNRLKFVKDKDLNVLQKYCYNYKGQQVDCSDNTSTSIILYKSIARSGPFTRINCGPGVPGSTVTYNQAAGAVTSVISQADADAKGLTKFNTDGLAYANTAGVCILPIVYTYDYTFSAASNSMTIRMYCSVANHPDATFNFIINYESKVNKPLILRKSFVLAAGQVSGSQTFTLSAAEGSESVDLNGPVQ